MLKTLNFKVSIWDVNPTPFGGFNACVINRIPNSKLGKNFHLNYQMFSVINSFFWDFLSWREQIKIKVNSTSWFDGDTYQGTRCSIQFGLVCQFWPLIENVVSRAIAIADLIYTQKLGSSKILLGMFMYFLVHIHAPSSFRDVRIANRVRACMLGKIPKHTRKYHTLPRDLLRF